MPGMSMPFRPLPFTGAAEFVGSLASLGDPVDADWGCRSPLEAAGQRHCLKRVNSLEETHQIPAAGSIWPRALWPLPTPFLLDPAVQLDLSAPSPLLPILGRTGTSLTVEYGSLKYQLGL